MILHRLALLTLALLLTSGVVLHTLNSTLALPLHGIQISALNLMIALGSLIAVGRAWRRQVRQRSRAPGTPPPVPHLWTGTAAPTPWRAMSSAEGSGSSGSRPTTAPWVAGTTPGAVDARQVQAARRALVVFRLRVRFQPTSARRTAAAGPAAVRHNVSRRGGHRPRENTGGHTARTSRHRRPRRTPRLPVPHIQFVEPGQRQRARHREAHLIVHLAALATEALEDVQPASAHAGFSALQEHATGVRLHLAASPLLAPVQQRHMIQYLQARGLHGRWMNDGTLTIRWPPALPRHAPADPAAALWLPVMRTRPGRLWWPLHTLQHLVLAGDMRPILQHLLPMLTRREPAPRAQVLVCDPTDQARDLLPNGPLSVTPDALARARLGQLRRHFVATRTPDSSEMSPAHATVLIVITPTEAIWSDLHPLFAPESGVHVIIIVGNRPPIPALRPICHATAVIEVPDPHYPALPDAYRPAGLAPLTHTGQALAWYPGGKLVWRGMPLLEMAVQGDC